MADAPVWTTACPDWEQRFLAGQSLIPFAPLFPQSAEEALAVLRTLCIVDVQGQPTIGDAARPWLLDLAAAIFGGYDPEAGRQLISEVFLLVSKKNWKSGLAASIMLTALVLNWRDSAEFLIIAPSVEVAGNSFKPAADMVRASPDLRKLLHVADFHRTIKHRTTGATLKVVAADAGTVSGKKATGVLVEELWEFGKRPHAEAMLVEATGGLAARPEGFVLYISTMSDQQPEGVFKQKLEYFRGVRDGTIHDPQALPVLYEWPERMLKEEAYRDPALWHLTNPNLGASVDRAFLEREFRKAEEEGASKLRQFYAKHLNVEVDVAMRAGGWAGAEYWPQRQIAGGLTLRQLLDRSEVCTIGIDGGGLDDLLALSVIGRERGTGRWLALNRTWAHPIVLQRRKSIAALLRDFAAAEELSITPAVGPDMTELVALVAEVRDAGLLPPKNAIGIDPGNSHAVLDALTAAEFPAEMLAAVSQGWRLGGSIKLTERRLADGTLWHAGQRIMAWAVGNAKVEPKGNAILVTKSASGTAKIDPIMALFNAVELMARAPAPVGASIYD